MYLADYHMHSRWSNDAHVPMAEMARAGVEAGLDEVCFTDHVELMESGSSRRNAYDFPALEREFEAAQTAVGGEITIRRGVELGEAQRDTALAEGLLAQLPPVDFIIGSVHQLSEKYGNHDLYYISAGEAGEAHRQIQDYLGEVAKLARWGKFSVLGHLTLPLRYMNENHGLHMRFDGFEAEVEEIFRTLIANGCGIEVNTNRGNAPLPEEKWLRLYRSCGGEIITIGSDAHTTQYVGCRVRETQALLRRCGFARVCTFRDLQPKFHTL